jgi:hypothetical protein
MQKMTRETLRILAAANGLTIPDDRLDLVLREYESLLRSLAELNALPLAREAEPASALPQPFSTPASDAVR